VATSKGALTWIPLGHSRNVDLIADFGDRLVRVQVKPRPLKTQTSGEGDRWNVSIATKGGNQSWSGVSKRFDPRRQVLGV
jgi:hypothetical protein